MSNRLFYPKNEILVPYGDSIIEESFAAQYLSQAKDLLMQAHYPCVPAVKSFRDSNFMVGFYGEFGSGQTWREIREDLIFFLEEQKRTKALYLSFWAVFSSKTEMDETNFEENLWKELSYLTSEELKEQDWTPGLCRDPKSQDFSFCINQEELFCVGMHPQASRKARQFFTPTIVINPVSQFLQLMEERKFEAITKVNRERDLKFQGSINPMVEKHATLWEPIQFSGKNNPETWVCPFTFMKDEDKP